MSVRRFVRGTVPWDQLEAVFVDLEERYDEDGLRVEFLAADNWFSTPCVVTSIDADSSTDAESDADSSDTTGRETGDQQWFVKVVSAQNAFVHSLFTGIRNLGVFSSGTEGFFEPFEGPGEMARHELEAAEQMREVGLNVPKPVESFDVDGLGVLVMEYLPEFETLDELDEACIEAYAPELFAALATMHENDLAHGDLRAENVLIYEEEIYLIDATKVSDEGIAAARAYDLACALAVLEPLVGASTAVEAAHEHYSADRLLAAREFLDFVGIRPDHDFDAAALKTELEAAAEE
ncbi:RIO1 family regulatory kinase/ATPase [Halospeciosus flavus]|uniref:non-specific serine/threonine protein kinase n=1 Tax=Halospeciosus flavus TaxID=3032283 RepID=A0ABD5Z3U8_9EURY|nr:RIO1 family regulatory kinase/ATPase [Halospeciosus flavus]